MPLQQLSQMPTEPKFSVRIGPSFCGVGAEIISLGLNSPREERTVNVVPGLNFTLQLGEQKRGTEVMWPPGADTVPQERAWLTSLCLHFCPSFPVFVHQMTPRDLGPGHPRGRLSPALDTAVFVANQNEEDLLVFPIKNSNCNFFFFNS